MNAYQELSIATKRMNAAKRALSLLNKLNGIQIKLKKDVSKTAARIKKLFGDMNRLRAALKRAENASAAILEVVNTHGQDITPKTPIAVMPGTAQLVAAFKRLEGGSVLKT